jgi:2-(1,2-epoxy-1,2-dihydrophenyl)acetyl-CoA isomerase
MTIQEQTVVLERNGAVATIRLNRPDVLNAFDRDLAQRLDAMLRTVEKDSKFRAVILTGTGRAFSAGQDVHELQREENEHGPAAVGEQLRERFNPIVLRLRAIEKPVIASINGVVAGAGLGFALACDVRIAAESATFVLAPSSIGFIPGVGTSILLPALIGLGRAAELTLLGERITAALALDYGIVNRVVPDAALSETTNELAERASKLPTRTIGLTKRALNRSTLPRIAEQLEYEAQLQEIAAGTHDHREGLAAMLEKRKPTFTGE